MYIHCVYIVLFTYIYTCICIIFHVHVFTLEQSWVKEQGKQKKMKYCTLFQKEKISCAKYIPAFECGNQAFYPYAKK